SSPAASRRKSSPPISPASYRRMLSATARGDGKEERAAGPTPYRRPSRATLLFDRSSRGSYPWLPTAALPGLDGSVWQDKSLQIAHLLSFASECAPEAVDVHLKRAEPVFEPAVFRLDFARGLEEYLALGGGGGEAAELDFDGFAFALAGEEEEVVAHLAEAELHSGLRIAD